MWSPSFLVITMLVKGVALNWHLRRGLPGLNEMRSEEDDTKDNAESSNDDVGDAKEVVLATDNGTSGDDDGLGASVLSSGEDYNSSISTLCENIPELAALWPPRITYSLQS